jgi:hypothetical protein
MQEVREDVRWVRLLVHRVSAAATKLSMRGATARTPTQSSPRSMKDNYLARLDLDAVDGAVIAAGNGGQEGVLADKLTESLQAAATTAPAGSPQADINVRPHASSRHAIRLLAPPARRLALLPSPDRRPHDTARARDCGREAGLGTCHRPDTGRQTGDHGLTYVMHTRRGMDDCFTSYARI